MGISAANYCIRPEYEANNRTGADGCCWRWETIHSLYACTRRKFLTTPLKGAMRNS